MGLTSQRKIRGFTLLELIVAMAIGLVVLGAAVSLFSQALRASFLVTQRAEMQQNGRAALDMIAKDITLAGAGIPSGGVQLPDGAGVGNSLFGCDTQRCYIANDNYPLNNHLFGVIPNHQTGQSVLTTSGNLGPQTDVLTVAYTDGTFPLNFYQVGMNANGTSVTFQLPNPAPNPLPSPWPPPPVNDLAVGLKVGDLVLFSNNLGQAVGEVTNVTAAGPIATVSFAANDVLNFNQPAATGGNLAAITNGGGANLPTTTANRLLVITYYVDTPAGPDGIRYTADDGPPRLMRQINGQTPTPVAENVVGLQATYDIFDDVSGVSTAGLPDAGMSQGKSPNQIRKVNVVVSARSPLQGTVGYQSLDLATSVSARDMSFKDRYN